jgi:uncharacterized cupin superfamily protein
MKLIDSNLLSENAIDHPYEDNPGFIAKINTFFYSEDKKAVTGYWEAPVGWFNAEITEQSELNYIIEGDIELFDIVTGEKRIAARKGDIFLVEAGDKLKWVIKKPIKTIFFIYPCPEELVDFFKNLKS